MAVTLPKEYSADVTHVASLTPHVRLIRLHSPKPIPFQAGQYASWLIAEYRRPLSFALPPSDPALEFIVGTQFGGVASQFVLNVAVGDTVRMLAPYGRFIVNEASARPQLYVAGSTGIAPIRAQIQHQLATRPQIPVTLIFGNRGMSDIFLLDEFKDLAATHTRFTFVPTVETPSPNWAAETGLVTEVLERQIAQPADYELYICGSPDMVRATHSLLEERGVPPEQIHTEQFT